MPRIASGRVRYRPGPCDGTLRAVVPIPIAAPVTPVGTAVPVAVMPTPVAGVPPVTMPIAAVPVPIPTVAISVAAVSVVAAERPLRFVDGGTDRRPDLLASRLGLGLGTVRGRGDRLAHVPLARTAAPVGMAASVAVPVTSIAPVAAPISVPAASPPVGTAVPVAVMPTPVASVAPVAIPIAAASATLARVRPTLATATTTVPATVTATAAALGVGDVVMDRQERSRQTAKEWDQCDHDDCQHQIPEERCHG